MSKVRYKMPTFEVILMLLILAKISPTECFKLTPGDERVTFNETSEDFYELTVDENVGDVVLFNTEDVKGSIWMKNDCSDLSNKANMNGSSYWLNDPIDFETYKCQDGKYPIRDTGGGKTYMFQVKVNNLDDNKPTFELNSNCVLRENIKYTKENTTCLLTMMDLDGMMEGTVFTIEDSVNSQIFGVSFLLNPEETDKKASVAIYLLDEKTLDYETKTSYVFKVNAQEEVMNSTVQVVIDVKDEPDQPPKFTKMFTTQQFEENIDQQFFVSAEDGDIGINSSISYVISENGCDGYKCDVTISEYGEINVKDVDREETGDTISLKIMAIEKDDSSSTALDVTFIIIDQDDNLPAIKIENSEITINEGTKGNIIDFSVEDMDLSDKGTFSIKLDNGESTVAYNEAFEIIPDSGYQNASFIITVLNSTALDYEDKDWKVITFNIVAVEKADETHTFSQPITINLKDINDEPPIFVNKTLDVDIPEDIKAGVTVFNALAVDRDEGDKVSYEIVGVWSQTLDISDQGIITTKTDNAFNYELVQQVLISIKASDTGPTHTATETLTINVQDVDDEPPVMTIDNKGKMVKIAENSEPGTVLDGVIVKVTDPDTKPKLKLEIDWQKSYATKNSGIKDVPNSVWQCFEVDTTAEESQTINRQISINAQCSPDFEIFDAILLFFTATDENTAIGDESTHGSILINIEDLNDNKPQFIDSSLKDLSVTDGTNTAKIGIIGAKDDDIGEKLHFSIQPVEGEPDWVDIDETSGQLTVKNGVVIDCDEPKRDTINYLVTVHDPDPDHNTTTKVSIHIEDINDEAPHIKWKTQEVVIPEKSEQLVVSTLDSEDADRDDPFNKVVFKFETKITDEASNRFAITDEGQISVKLRNGASLDRDNGPASFILPILAYDNPKGTLQLKDNFELKVILKDIDDHVPKLNQSLSCTENMKKGEILGDLDAFDPDEDGPNSNVSFVFTKIESASNENKNALDETFLEIQKIGTKKATISILKPLRGFWGDFNLIIRTQDAGSASAYNDNVIHLTVEKFNFEQPVFTFPETEADRFIIVDKDHTTAKMNLILYNGENLKNLNVDDRQDHKWDVTFEIKDEDGNNEADVFRIVKSPTCNWEGALQLQRSLNEQELNQEHTVTINAKVKDDMKTGEAPVSVETTMKIKFFSSSEQPHFSKKKATVNIKENSWNLTAIPDNATFSVDNLKPYYFIVHPSDTFQIEPGNGTIKLKQTLDFESIYDYDLKISAQNKNVTPSDQPDEGGNVLDVIVKVLDMNDNPPVFTPSKFSGAFLRTYNKGTTILTVNATDADPTLQSLKFSLKNFNCSESLKAPDPPFLIGPDGTITNAFTVTSDMSGYCKFIVEVEDQADIDGTVNIKQTTVQINIISANQLVKFTFFNTDGFINENIDAITALINDVLDNYHYESFLADLTYHDTFRNTTANFFFINSNGEPVLANEILGNLTDPNKYGTLSKSLANIHVQLYYFSYNTDPKVVEDYLKIWLIVVIVILGSLLTLLTIIFFFRSRALTRRIKNLSTTKFGSQDSGLNRAGIAAPTTNRNAIEGSNPVFNSESYIKEMDDDTNSVLSGDSDLLGVENNPDFDI